MFGDAGGKGAGHFNYKLSTFWKRELAWYWYQWESDWNI